MQIGVIGLGRLGANMVRRLGGAEYECVLFDLSPNAVEPLAGGEDGKGRPAPDQEE
jgi:6-phosphogluconate dehydrogenase